MSLADGARELGPETNTLEDKVTTDHVNSIGVCMPCQGVNSCLIIYTLW